MRYAIRLINNPRPQPIFVEAAEFHSMGQSGGITFFAERMRPTGGIDQWGNPRMQRARVSVAFFNNVESVLELPEEDPGVPEMATEGLVGNERVPFNMGGDFPGATPWGELQHGVGGRGIARDQDIPPPAPIRVDDDGVNWDAERAE